MVVKLLIAIVIGVIVMIVSDIFLDHAWAVLVGFLAGAAYFLSGPTTLARP